MKTLFAWLATLYSLILVCVCSGMTNESIQNMSLLHEEDQVSCCSNLVRDLNFRITNPSYPDSDSGSKKHSYRTQMQRDMCGLRVTFEDVKLKLPGFMSTCSTDSVTILAKNFPTQLQCGFLKNFQVNVPVKEGDVVEVLVVVQSTKHSWNMVISQIPCASIDSNPLAKYEDHCGKRPRFNFLWGTGIHELALEGENLANDEGEASQTIINDSDMNSCDATGDLFRCNVERVVDKIAAKTVQNNRVVNGQTARRSWPWQIVLLIQGKHLLCGGALIAPNIAVTAAHCFKAVQKTLGLQNIVIASGVHRMGAVSRGVQFRRCKAATIHPQYADINQDIALCYFDEPMTISDRTRHICLPYERNHTFAGERGIITGWGRTTNNGGPASILQEASIPIVSNEACTEAWEETGGRSLSTLIDSSMVCGGGNNRSTCNGDSGGPLSFHDTRTDRYTLVGLTSFGPSAICNVPGKPLSVFTRITAHLPFLSLATAEISVDTKGLQTYLSC